MARFSFNNGVSADEISHKQPKLVNTRFVEDRFGNTCSAVLLFGDYDSYINLGNYPALKPNIGSISLWTKITTNVHYGSGIPVNPIIATRNCSCSDYNEAYAIYLNPASKTFEGLLSNDSLKQLTLQVTSGEVKVETWYHLVLTYNNDSAAIYMNGKLEIALGKHFESYFEPTDSVMIGSIYNKKNKRVLRGTIDDIQFFDRVLSPKEVELLYHAPNPDKNRILLDKILIILTVVAILVSIYQFIRYRFNLQLKKEKQRLEQANKLLENELRINRALMNPHFMFNSLNTLHHYILTHDIEKASDYLLKFSKLIRKILDTNMSDTITLEQEIELLERYLEIESLRFKEHFQYRVFKESDVVPPSIVIPIMMLQPFIENSVWHGLRDKTGDKIISVSFSLQGDTYLKCVIEDNGTGRRQKTGNTEKKSLATNFVLQRLALLNKIHQLDCHLSIIDKPGHQGTIVAITLPILNKLHSYASTFGNH